MAKRKKRPQTATHHKKPKASVEKSNHKLWYTLAGLAVIVLIIAWGGWYIPKHRMHILAERLATLIKCHTLAHGRMPLEDETLRARGHVPKFDRLVPTPRRQFGTIR